PENYNTTNSIGEYLCKSFNVIFFQVTLRKIKHHYDEGIYERLPYNYCSHIVTPIFEPDDWLDSLINSDIFDVLNSDMYSKLHQKQKMFDFYLHVMLEESRNVFIKSNQRRKQFSRNLMRWLVSNQIDGMVFKDLL